MSQLKQSSKLRRRHWILAAALAAIPGIGVASHASAQAQQQTTGRALDANNRIGSGGTNTVRPAPTVGVYGNQIVTGNVAGGAAFHGFVPYSDPNAFRGFTAGQATDSFIRDSTGAGVPNQPPPLPNAKEAYYGESRFAPPPVPGFVQSKTTPGFVPAQPLVVQPNDARLGAQLDATNNTPLPKPGELILPGPIDATSNQQTVLTASPLTGVRQWNMGDANDMNFLNRQGFNPLERANMTLNDLQRMREELRLGPTLPNGATPFKSQFNNQDSQFNGPDQLQGTNGLNTAPSSYVPGKAMQPLENPNNPNLAGQRMTSSFTVNPVSGNLTTDQGYMNKVLGAPQQQSSQYDELKKRLEKFQGERKDPAKASAQAFNDAMHKKEADAAKAGTTPGTSKQPTAVLSGTPDKGTPGVTNKIKEPVKPTPPMIGNLGQGMQSKGLAEMLDKAQSLMKEGKFTSAIDQYAAAEAVAPNQPLVWIGRANAELGASYYNRAEAHLKQAFQADQALLMAKYDLRAFLGEERLQSVIKDLKDIAATDQQSPTAVFLLAYVAYNTGNERRAAGYLDIAEKRTGGKDPVLKLLRDHWTLPSTQETTPDEKGAPEINK